MFAYAFIYIYIYIYKYVQTHTFTHKRSTNTRTRTHTHAHTHSVTRTQMYTHTHRYTFEWSKCPQRQNGCAGLMCVCCVEWHWRTWKFFVTLISVCVFVTSSRHTARSPENVGTTSKWSAVRGTSQRGSWLVIRVLKLEINRSFCCMTQFCWYLVWVYFRLIFVQFVLCDVNVTESILVFRWKCGAKSGRGLRPHKISGVRTLLCGAEQSGAERPDFVF